MKKWGKIQNIIFRDVFLSFWVVKMHFYIKKRTKIDKTGQSDFLPRIPTQF